MNNVVLIGRLTKDVELKYTSNQTSVAHFSLAVNRPQAQNNENSADFIRITVFGKQAENCNRYLSKGRQAAVSGRIQTGSYKDRDGRTVYTTDIIANNVEFLGGNEQGKNNRDMQQSNYRENNSYEQNGRGVNTERVQYEQESFNETYDDIPF